MYENPVCEGVWAWGLFGRDERLDCVVGICAGAVRRRTWLPATVSGLSEVHRVCVGFFGPVGCGRLNPLNL